MKIADIFRRPITRRIEEVIKVDLAEEQRVADEIDEYVVTRHIAESFETVFDRYQETINKPDEGTNAWVSGFFGSGKSSFAKILGYLLENPILAGRSATEWFLGRVDSPRIEALLNTIHTQAPARSVFVDLSTGHDVLVEGESVVLPLYRALLTALGYSRNTLLAELEYDLETDGQLGSFVEIFNGLSGDRGNWERRRNVGLARGEASQAMHLLRPDTYPQADSWSNAAQQPNIDANWFADRAVTLLRRRGEHHRRLVFVVDEVGQYVARSVERMLDLQGLAHAIQKQRGILWLVATSQEKLDDVVESLEGRQVELARVQARFPIRVDLLPEDIDEVAGRRVLDKNDAGQRAVREKLTPFRQKLNTNVRINSPTRAEDLAEDEFVRLYPLVPYQVPLLIDAISARRAQGRGTPMLGGSNRTIIKLAQQLIVDPKAGLGSGEVGELVSLDRAYQLLESIIPTSWQAEVRSVATRYGEHSPELAVARVLALCVDVAALTLEADNVAALLHPSVSGESLRGTVESALAHLVGDEVIRHGEGGYRLQSPEEKDWERARRGIEARPASRTKLRRELLQAGLSGLSANVGRTFRVAVHVEGEKMLDGDIPLLVEEADAARQAELRTTSRDPSATAMVWWVYREALDTTDTLDDLYRSQQMIERREAGARTSSEVGLLGEERDRFARLQTNAMRQLERDLLAGQSIFHGRSEDVAGNTLRGAAQQLVASRVREIYPKLDQFSAPVTKNDVVAVLRAADLRGLPSYLGEGNLGLTLLTPTGVELATERDPLAVFIAEVRQRANYGNEATGGYLEQHFGRPPFGASIEVVQALAAAGIRAGLVEAIYGGARLSRPNDPRLEKAFATLPAFRSASFVPQADEVDVTVRGKVAQRLAELTGERPSLAIDDLARRIRAEFGKDSAACDRVVAGLRGLGLPIPEAVSRTSGIVERLASETDKDAIRTISETWADLVAGRKTVESLDKVLSDEVDAVRFAVAELRAGAGGLGDEARNDLEALRDLLNAGDLGSHLANIKSRAGRLRSARDLARERLNKELQNQIGAETHHLQHRFSTVEATKLEEALRPLRELLPADQVVEDPEVLAARLEAVGSRSQSVARTLEDLAEAGRLVRLPIGRFAPDPIASVDDLETVLSRLREAVEGHLAEDKKVKLA